MSEQSLTEEEITKELERLKKKRKKLERINLIGRKFDKEEGNYTRLKEDSMRAEIDTEKSLREINRKIEFLINALISPEKKKELEEAERKRMETMFA